MTQKYFALLLSISLLFFVSCQDTADTTTPEKSDTADSVTPKAAVAQSFNFHHLKLDSAVLVDSFFKKSADDTLRKFKKILFTYKVNDYSEFPEELTLAGFIAKRNDDYLDCGGPEILDILPEYETLENVLLANQELAKWKIKELVGRMGTARSYQYLLFVPYVIDSCNHKTLAYRVTAYPKLSGAGDPVVNTNPCPPYKPND
jgi:hypothetical protein